MSTQAPDAPVTPGTDQPGTDQPGTGQPGLDHTGETEPAVGGPRRYLWGLVLAVAAAAVVALIEIEAQSERIVDARGRAWPLSVLFGADGREGRAGWAEVVDSGLISNGLFGTILGWHLAVDAVLIVAYALLLRALVRTMFRTTGARRWMTRLVMAVVIADVVEDLAALVLLIAPAGAPALRAVLAVATTAKWWLLIATILALLVRLIVRQRPPRPTDARPTLLRIVRSLMHHRFSVALVVPLLVLTVLSGSAILEQLPDVQRRWASDGVRGWIQAGFAILALVAVGILLEVLARFRTGWAERHQGPEESEPRVEVDPAMTVDGAWLRALRTRLMADVRLGVIMLVELITDRPRLRGRVDHLRASGNALLGLWLLGAAIPLLAAVIAAATLDAPVLSSRLLTFCAVPLAVVVISWVLRRAWQIRPDWAVPDRPPHFDEREVATIRFTGHALALTVITIGGLGLIRSFLSVVMLGPAITGVPRGVSILFLLVGVAAVAAPWMVSWWLARRKETVGFLDPLETVGSTAATSLRGRWILLTVIVAIFVVLAVLPGAVAWAGVSAAAILCLSSLIGIPAAAGLLIQERPTAEVFRILGLRRTPLVSVLVITVVLAALTAGGSTIHAVHDQPRSATPPTRPAISGMVQDWLAQPGCEVTVGGQRVRPMIMVAAEGGGIRAAYWTVQGLAAIDRGNGGCGAHSTLFSGGASGGSVGLTVARFSGTPDDPGTARAVDAVRAMAGPRPLAEAVVGTFVRDPAYGATGVPIGSGGIAPARSWADRARLIELGWDRAYAAGQPWGNVPFLTADDRLSPSTGELVLNSSSVQSECRAWVSQLDLEQPEASSGEQQCDRRVGPGARTVDLFSAYGPVGGSGPTCLGPIDASTAALLTARFPYVTPGGVVGGCGVAGRPADDAWPRTQLIDGGYIENTGLATVTDLSSQWLSQVRAHNDAVVASGRTDQALIMPIVVFLTNEQPTAGRLTSPPQLQSELLLPAVGYLRGQATLTRTDALLQRVATTVRTRSICPPPVRGGIDCDAISNAFPRRVIVVDRSAVPEVTAPLGWVLSAASMTALDKAMDHQVDTRCDQAPTEPACLRGYGTLGDLLGYLTTG